MKQPVPWPAPVGHPPLVGTALATGLRDSSQAGYLLDVVDGQGTAAVGVLLSAGAAQDAAARDRFRQAAELLGRRRPGLVRDSTGLDDDAPWVLLSVAVEDQVARRLLGSAFPPDADEEPRAGPRFRMFWRIALGTGRAPWSGTRVPPWRRMWWLAGVVAFMAILGLLLAMCTGPVPTQPQPTPGGSTGSPQSGPGQSPSGSSPSGGGPGEQSGPSGNARYALGPGTTVRS